MAASFQQLLQRYELGELSRPELDVFFSLLEEKENREALAAGIDAKIADDRYIIADDAAQAGQGFAALKLAISAQRRRVYRAYRWAAAAAVLLAVATIFLLTGSPKTTPPIAVQKEMLTPQPGREGAVLVLADGRQVVLDSLGNGIIAKQGATSVRVENGRLVYDVGAGTGAALYNTMNTPRGRQFQLELPDGSKVWLNAGSSIRFPTVFAGNERRVSITGEAYFEIRKERRLPFIVEAGQQQVTVLGTHFNTKAYAEENMVTTTLLEGSVKISAGDGSSRVIRPGEQAASGTQGTIAVSRVNTEEAIAWRNGYFVFNDADIRNIMHNISRWYDVDVIYRGTVSPRKFGGAFPRSTGLQDLLSYLESYNVAHFTVNGKTITVTP